MKIEIRKKINDHQMKLRVVEQKPPIQDNWSIVELVKNYCPYTWESVFEKSVNEFADIDEILEQDKKKYGQWIPGNKNLFKAFHLTPLPRVKVVVFGQDPYAGVKEDGPIAVGLAFSVKRTAAIPSSLNNIFKELEKTVTGFRRPQHGDLTSWATQGVMLLNSCLTVRQGEPGCHKEIWHGFIKRVIQTILDQNPNCIFVAWGKNAQKVANKFVGEKGTILTAAHPSGLSANRGFFGCNHFNQINELLVARGQEPIDWNIS